MVPTGLWSPFGWCHLAIRVAASLQLLRERGGPMLDPGDADVAPLQTHVPAPVWLTPAPALTFVALAATWHLSSLGCVTSAALSELVESRHSPLIDNQDPISNQQLRLVTVFIGFKPERQQCHDRSSGRRI